MRAFNGEQNSEYERVGGGAYGVYRKKPEKKKKADIWGWLGVGLAVLMILGAVSG